MGENNKDVSSAIVDNSILEGEIVEEKFGIYKYPNYINLGETNGKNTREIQKRK